MRESDEEFLRNPVDKKQTPDEKMTYWRNLCMIKHSKTANFAPRQAHHHKLELVSDVAVSTSVCQAVLFCAHR